MAVMNGDKLTRGMHSAVDSSHRYACSVHEKNYLTESLSLGDGGIRECNKRLTKLNKVHDRRAD